MTGELRTALDDVGRALVALAVRVHAAHTARVWAPLGYASWAAYCAGELHLSRAQAYRLLTVARTARAVHSAVRDALPPVSRTRDTPADYGLSQRALLAVSGRTDDVADHIAHHMTALALSGAQPPDDDAVRDAVRRAIEDVRATPAPARRETSADLPPGLLREGAAAVQDLIALQMELGRLMLEVAPAYLSEHDAADLLEPFCEEIGQPLHKALADRRYAITGDSRALKGSVL